MCSHEFSAWFVRCCAPAGCKPSRARLERIKISEPYNIWMRSRSKSAVVRFFQVKKYTDDYYYSLLVLFLPHINESNILMNNNHSSYENAREAFKA